MSSMGCEESIAALCRKEGIPTNLYYRWSKEFLEAGKKRLMGDAVREVTRHVTQKLSKSSVQFQNTDEVVASTVYESHSPTIS